MFWNTVFEEEVPKDEAVDDEATIPRRRMSDWLATLIL